MPENDPDEIVRVSICWTERTTYFQYKKMSRKDFEARKERAYAVRGNRAEEFIDGELRLSRDSWQGADDMRIEEFEIETEEETEEETKEEADEAETTM